jgi:hypothetical protein
MDYKLVAIKIKIRPLVRAAAFAAAKHFAVKLAGFFKVVNGYCYVERGHDLVVIVVKVVDVVVVVNVKQI